GVVPLLLGTGAGAEMRRTLGIAVFSGMLGVTLFGIFLTPVFFYVIQWFVDPRSSSAAAIRVKRRTLRVALDIATRGLAWLPALVGRRRPRVSRSFVDRARRPTLAVGSNGTEASSNGNGQAPTGVAEPAQQK